MKVWPGTTANRGEIIVEDGQFVGKLATAVAGSGNMVEMNV